MIAMKPRRDTHNFYESFSDLIFNTLVLFLFLILGLAVNVNKRVESVAADEARVAAQLRESRQRLEEQLKAERALRDRRAALDKEAEALATAVAAQKKRSENLDREIEAQQAGLKQIVAQQEQAIQDAKRRISDLEGSTRFTGSSGSALLSVALVPDSTGGKVYFVPGDAGQRYQTDVVGESEAEAVTRRQQIVQDAVDAARLQRGMTIPECQKLLRAISWFRGDRSEKVRMSVTMFSAFSEGVARDKGQTFSYADSRAMLVTLRTEPSAPDVKPMPTLRVQVPTASGSISVGSGTSLTPPELVCLLRSSSGTKLAIDLDIGKSEQIPDWFLKDVMRATGYLNRVPDLPAPPDK